MSTIKNIDDEFYRDEEEEEEEEEEPQKRIQELQIHRPTNLHDHVLVMSTQTSETLKKIYAWESGDDWED